MAIDHAATFPTCFLTASHALFPVAGLTAGETVLIHAAGSGVSVAAIFSLAIGGRLVCCGNTSGDAATIPSLGFLFHSGAKIVGSDPYWPEEFGPRGRSSSTLGFPPPSTQSSHSPMLPSRSSDWNPVTCSARSSCVHDRDLDRRRAIPRVGRSTRWPAPAVRSPTANRPWPRPSGRQPVRPPRPRQVTHPVTTLCQAQRGHQVVPGTTW